MKKLFALALLAGLVLALVGLALITPQDNVPTYGAAPTQTTVVQLPLPGFKLVDTQDPNIDHTYNYWLPSPLQPGCQQVLLNSMAINNHPELAIPREATGIYGTVTLTTGVSGDFYFGTGYYPCSNVPLFMHMVPGTNTAPFHITWPQQSNAVSGGFNFTGGAYQLQILITAYDTGAQATTAAPTNTPTLPPTNTPTTAAPTDTPAPTNTPTPLPPTPTPTLPAGCLLHADNKMVVCLTPIA